MSIFYVQKKRLSYQRVGPSSVHCCVPRCTCSSRYNSRVSFHSFPANKRARRRWLVKIRRDFNPNRNQKVCSRHFLPSDIVLKPKGSRWLKKGAMPLLFEWNNYSLPVRPSESPEDSTDGSSSTDHFSESEMEKVPSDSDHSESAIEMVVGPDHAYSISPEMANELQNVNENLRKQLENFRSQVEKLHLQSRFCLERFACSDEDICFYTGFSSYRHFQYFWKLIQSQSTNSNTSAYGSDRCDTSTNLPPIDELFLFLMYLSLGQPHRDLAEKFGIHQTTVSRIITVWANFLYHLLGSKRLWLPREVVRARLPLEFARVYSDTQVVLDYIKIHCQTPSDLLSCCDMFSAYESYSTLKAIVGMAPHGDITFVSALYAASMSDREIFQYSGIAELLEPDMAIMADKHFRITSVAPCKVYKKEFLSAKKPFSSLMLSQSAVLRLRVGRCMGRVKRNKLFDRVLPVSLCEIINELFSVACYLVNYQNGPLEKDQAT